MKTLLTALTLAAFVGVVNLSPVSAVAAQYGAPSVNAGTGHYEWQYHYAGHHPRYQGGWVWVK